MHSTPPLVIALATEPDLGAAKRAYGLGALSDAEAQQAIATLRRIADEPIAWPLALQRISAVAVAGWDGQAWCCRALAGAGASEAELLRDLFQQVQQAQSPSATPLLAWQPEHTWALLEARALRHGLPLPMAEPEPQAAWRSAAGAFVGLETLAQGLSLQEFAAAMGEACSRPRRGAAALATDAVVTRNAVLHLRLALRWAAARGLVTAAHQQSFAAWAQGAFSGALAALSGPLLLST